MGLLQLNKGTKMAGIQTQECEKPSSDGVVLSGRGPRPDPEVLEKPHRRRFTAAYKMRILEEADKCKDSGQVGALLRREGLYFSNLTTWRRQKEEGILTGLSPQKRGRKVAKVNPLTEVVSELEKEIARLRRELQKTTAIIDIQKKVSILLGVHLEETVINGNRS